MKNVLLTILFGLLILAGCTSKPSTGTQQNLTAPEAKQLMETNQEVVVLDVRTPEEFQDGHVSGAVNLDFYAPDFEKQLAELDKTGSYLVYCASGNRSGKTAAKMEDLKFRKIYNSQAGFQELKSEGVPTK